MAGLGSRTYGTQFTAAGAAQLAATNATLAQQEQARRQLAAEDARKRSGSYLDDTYRLSLVQTAYDRVQVAIAQGNLASARSSLAYMVNTHGTMSEADLKAKAFALFSAAGAQIEKAEAAPEAMEQRKAETAKTDAAVVAAVVEGNKDAKERMAAEATYIENAQNWGAVGAEVFDLGGKAKDAAAGALDAIALPSLGLGLAVVGIAIAFLVVKLA